MADIKRQFNDRAPINISNFVLTVQASGDFIPGDLLGQSQLMSCEFITQMLKIDL